MWHHWNVYQEMGILAIEQQGGLQLKQTRMVVNQQIAFHLFGSEQQVGSLLDIILFDLGVCF